MALVACKECGNRISSKAATCPKCGIRAPKKTSRATWWFVGFLGFSALALWLSPKPPSPAPIDPATAAADAKALVAKKARDDLETARYAAATGALDAIKRQAHDPKSVAVEYAGTDAAGNVICVAFRARNAFGALVKQTAVFDGKSSSLNDAARWSRQCTKTRLFDQTRLVD